MYHTVLRKLSTKLGKLTNTTTKKKKKHTHKNYIYARACAHTHTYGFVAQVVFVRINSKERVVYLLSSNHIF